MQRLIICLALALIASLALTGEARAVSITLDFNDGPADGAPIDAFYQSRGVIFSAGTWDDVVSVANPPPVPGTSAPFGLTAAGVGNIGQTWAGRVVTATFLAPVSSVSVVAADVGVNGARIEAFGGGVFRGSDQFIGSGTGGNQFRTLGVVANDIDTLRFFQRQNVTNDGVVFDNLTYEIENNPPIANPGGPYLVDEGGVVTLDASGSFDPDPFGPGILEYAWDIDGDGAIDNVGGPIFDLDIGFLQGAGERLIQLSVTDQFGELGTAGTILSIQSAAVPEPATLGLAGVGLACALAARRRRS